jgi:hypothetical protein
VELNSCVRVPYYFDLGHNGKTAFRRYLFHRTPVPCRNSNKGPRHTPTCQHGKAASSIIIIILWLLIMIFQWNTNSIIAKGCQGLQDIHISLRSKEVLLSSFSNRYRKKKEAEGGEGVMASTSTTTTTLCLLLEVYSIRKRMDERTSTFHLPRDMFQRNNSAIKKCQKSSVRCGHTIPYLAHGCGVPTFLVFMILTIIYIRRTYVPVPSIFIRKSEWLRAARMYRSQL